MGKPSRCCVEHPDLEWTWSGWRRLAVSLLEQALHPPHEKVEVHLAIGTDAALVDYFLAHGQSIRLYVGDYVEGEESNPKRYDTVIPLTAADSALSPRAFGFTHGLQKKMAFAVAFNQDGEPIARTNVAYSMLLDQELAALTNHIRAYTEFGESVASNIGRPSCCRWPNSPTRTISTVTASSGRGPKWSPRGTRLRSWRCCV
ncbi:MAG: hypothetical protein D6690_10645 [Nitrospirae bacterium]|nr:MAG: hypothetical protein D6690_10645 [Nitrospirota bacterium]